MSDSPPAPGRKSPRVVTTVHARGAATLDGMMELTERASRALPLDEVLASIVEQIARLAGVEVCSLYLHDEHEDDLVLRATHGFPQDAVGVVRMRVGEGLTGFAVECLRPVSVAAAVVDSRNKRFEALREERFPALCAMPLVDGGRGVGAIVIQRREMRAFDEREVVQLAAMAPAVLFALERARSRQRAAAALAQAPAPSSRALALALRGKAASPGRALGPVTVQRARLAVPSLKAGDRAAERDAVERGFLACAEEIAALDVWARERLAALEGTTPKPILAAARARLLALRFALDDDRMRKRVLRHVDAGVAAAAAVERVAREYARVLGTQADDTLRERAIELESLCARLVERLLPGATIAEPAPGRVLVAGHLAVFEAIALARTRAAGCILAGPAEDSPGLPLLHALGVPAVCEVKTLFRWVHDGDRLFLDGDEGAITVNPSRGDVAAFRRERDDR